MKHYIYVLFFCLFTFGVQAQPFEDSTNPNDNLQSPEYDWSWKTGGIPTTPPPPPTPVPIDGGVGFLLIVGLGYGLRSMKK